MIDQIVSGVAREIVQNSGWLPRLALRACAVFLAVGALTFPDQIAEGFKAAGDEMADRLAGAMNIDRPARPADPTSP